MCALLDRRRTFNPRVEVAVHPVGASDVEVALERICLAVTEPEDPAMFKEPANRRGDANVLAESRNSGANTAESTHDQIDARTVHRSAIERVGDAAILELVHLGNDAASLAFLRQRTLTLDQLDEATLHRNRRNEEFLILRLTTAASHVVEQADEIFGDRRVARENAKVFIDASGF